MIKYLIFIIVLVSCTVNKNTYVYKYPEQKDTLTFKRIIGGAGISVTTTDSEIIISKIEESIGNPLRSILPIFPLEKRLDDGSIKLPADTIMTRFDTTLYIIQSKTPYKSIKSKKNGK